MGSHAQCHFASFLWHFANAPLFIDACQEGYVDYLNKLLPLVRPGGLIVGHNINRGQADTGYIEPITKNPALESLLVHGQVSLTMKKR